MHSFPSPRPAHRPGRLHGPSLVLGAVGAPGVRRLGAVVVVLLSACGGRVGLLDGVPERASGVDDAGVKADPPEAAAPSRDAAADAVASSPPAATTTASPTASSTPGAPADPCATMPPVPCPGGGYEYCVAGHYSACPSRCGVCVPGSSRVCFITYCKAWGVQTCSSDGLSFGYCQENSPPSQCQSIADDDKASPALEQCCIDSGNCCQDLYDLNGNGDTTDLIGSCSGTSC